MTVDKRFNVMRHDAFDFVGGITVGNEHGALVQERIFAQFTFDLADRKHTLGARNGGKIEKLACNHGGFTHVFDKAGTNASEAFLKFLAREGNGTRSSPRQSSRLTKTDQRGGLGWYLVRSQ